MTRPGGRGTRHDHAQIRDVARRLQREAAAIAKAGPLSDLTTRGRPPRSAFGTWDAAKSLAATVDQGNTQVTRAYRQFLQDFQAAAAALEKVADNYKTSDDATLARIKEV